MRSWIMMVTAPTVTAIAAIPARMAQTRRKRSSIMARIMRFLLAEVCSSFLFASNAYGFNKSLPTIKSHEAGHHPVRPVASAIGGLDFGAASAT